MSDVLGGGYIRAARLKGPSERRVIRRHALPNALAPGVAVIALDVGHLLGGLIVLQEVFAWPGLGRLLIYALEIRDLPVIRAAPPLLAAFCAISNLLTAILDLRVRHASRLSHRDRTDRPDPADDRGGGRALRAVPCAALRRCFTPQRGFWDLRRRIGWGRTSSGGTCCRAS